MKSCDHFGEKSKIGTDRNWPETGKSSTCSETDSDTMLCTDDFGDDPGGLFRNYFISGKIIETFFGNRTEKSTIFQTIFTDMKNLNNKQAL